MGHSGRLRLSEVRAAFHLLNEVRVLGGDATAWRRCAVEGLCRLLHAIGLTKTLAREYARKGVTVNAIAPGFIKTRMTQDLPEKVLESVQAMTPAGRLGDPV